MSVHSTRSLAKWAERELQYSLRDRSAVSDPSAYGGAIPGRNRGGRRVSVSGSNAEPRGRCAGATAARAGFRRRRRLTTLNEQGELPVLEWIAVSGLILVHMGPRPQGAPAPGLHCPCFPSMTTRPRARFIPSAYGARIVGTDWTACKAPKRKRRCRIQHFAERSAPPAQKQARGRPQVGGLCKVTIE
jgi:hypothetical protein